MNNSGNDLMARLDFFAEMGRAGNFSGAAFLVAFNLLYHHLNGTTGRCDPAISTLAEETGLQHRSVKRAIRELEKSGWWIVGHRKGGIRFGGRSNTYTPNFIKGGDQPVTTVTTQVVTNLSPLQAEGGDSNGQKVVTNRSPKPRKNQEEDSYMCRAALLFEDFWRAYPSRAPHGNPEKPARVKFEAALKRGVDPNAIIRGAENYARYVREYVADRQHIAMALTWLNQERWSDHQQPPDRPPRRVAGMF